MNAHNYSLKLCLEVHKGMEWNEMIIREWKGNEWNGMYLSKEKKWKRIEWNEIK